MSPEDLAKRVQVLEDIEDIKRLKHRYCGYCDADFDVDSLVELFTEDAVWDGGDLGRGEGREGIRAFFNSAAQRLAFSIHMVMNPVIEVDGDKATGTWYLLEPCTYRDDNQAVWGSARYDEQYVRVNGEWKFKHLILSSNFWTPFDKGWVEARLA